MIGKVSDMNPSPRCSIFPFSGYAETAGLSAALHLSQRDAGSGSNVAEHTKLAY